jgi:hypothetical protein
MTDETTLHTPGDEGAAAPETTEAPSTSARCADPGRHVLTGCQTNLDNVCIVLGDITVTTDDGPARLTGFHMLPANRGTKRVGHAHADTWWVTVHHTTLTDQRDIEDEMTDESAELNSRRLLELTTDELHHVVVNTTKDSFTDPFNYKKQLGDSIVGGW